MSFSLKFIDLDINYTNLSNYRNVQFKQEIVYIKQQFLHT